MDSNNLQIHHVQMNDKDFWFSLDKHLSVAEFDKKVRDKQGYVLFADNCPVGILRYNLFWDNTPFCTLLYIDDKHQRMGYGKILMCYWENEMKALGYERALVSTRSDENAQHFYRAIGYQDCGCLIAPDQPVEIFFEKHLK